MATLGSDPDLYDAKAWGKLVEDLRAASGDDASPDYLAYVEAHLAAIERFAERTATGAFRCSAGNPRRKAEWPFLKALRRF